MFGGAYKGLMSAHGAGFVYVKESVLSSLCHLIYMFNIEGERGMVVMPLPALIILCCLQPFASRCPSMLSALPDESGLGAYFGARYRADS